jgi:dipeptidyl aminopeptidase/acylaminoacyl peptidase
VFPEPAGRLARTDRSGASTTLDLEPRGYWFVRASPDGERLAFHAGPGQKNDIGVADLRRGVTRRIQVGGFVNQEPAWSPDGQWLAFSSNRDGPTNIYRIAADGSGEPVRLAPSDEPQEMSSWSSTGVIAYLQGGDIWVLPPDGEPAPLVQTPAFDFDASFSPDGEWLAYVSADNEAAEVFLRPYPGPGSAIQVSSGGGVNPAWSPDGRVLYYVHDGRDASTLMAVEVGGGTPLRPGRPRDLISPWGCCRVPVRGFDVLRDGSFVTTRAGDDEAVPVREIHVVLRFDELLRRRFDQ